METTGTTRARPEDENPDPAEIETMIASLGTVDHRGVAWANVRWSAYLIHQQFRYEYPGQIHDLRQRLMLVPPDRHGDQRLVSHKLEVSVPGVEVAPERDRFGNLVLTVLAPHVAERIGFTAWIVVERDATLGPLRLPAAALADPAYREPTRLTAPDDALRAMATELGDGEEGLALARRINAAVFAAMTYEHGPTGVRTPAAAAFALRRGVCQDYAHVMLALCRERGQAARYVSGHLLGEGGTHAWVEVLLPDPNGDGAIAHPFDPTHGTEPGLGYVTVAVGRDYGDVAPTSGVYRAPYAGRLSGSKRAGLTALEYFPEHGPSPAASTE